MKCPLLSSTVVIADDARLAAQISCSLASPKVYLPVIDGPRIQRPDRDSEVIRRNNAAERARAAQILLAGLSVESRKAIANGFTPKLRARIKHIETAQDAAALTRSGPPLSSPPLAWGRDRIGIGLLNALYSRTNIVFTDSPSPTNYAPPKGSHLVVCEEDEDLSQVIAANYAFAIRAGLYLIPAVDDAVSTEILEALYSVYEHPDASASEALELLRRRLRDLTRDLPIPIGGSLTFISHHLPYGFAHPQVPSTHLFSYPDLGIAVINGFSAEQPNTRGVSVAALIDPETTDAPEIEAATKLLAERGTFVRSYRGPGANVRAVSDAIYHFPFDLLILATHCGDAPGYRWTYEFEDSEGIARRLVVDLAVGFARTDDEDLFDVTQFTRFVSLDGVDWNDPRKSEKVYIGNAMRDFMERTKGPTRSELQPVLKEAASRVVGSAVLRMNDQNFIALPRPIADEGTPIVINNACCSWHRLAETFTFANARTYIGTLFPVSTTEAHDVIVRLLGKHYGKPLAHALWSAQRTVYGEGVRRPYIVTGVYPQRLRIERHNIPRRVASRLARSRAAWQAILERADRSEPRRIKGLEQTVKFYERELKAIYDRWLT